MSKPSAKSRKSIRHPSMVRPHLARTDSEATELRKMLHDILTGVRQWGLKLEAMTRQKYDPDSMVEATENFLQMYEFFAHVVEKAATIPHPNPAQVELKNAAEILLFYQGPILEGCLSGTSAGETLDAFLKSVNEVMDAGDSETVDD